LSLECKFDVTTNLLDINAISQSDTHAVERNKTIFCNSLGLLEKFDYQLYNLAWQLFVDSSPNLEERHLKNTAEQVL